MHKIIEIETGKFNADGRDKIAILTLMTRVPHIADSLRKEGLNPVIGRKPAPPGLVFLEITCHSQADYEEKALKVTRFFKKDMIDTLQSN